MSATGFTYSKVRIDEGVQFKHGLASGKTRESDKGVTRGGGQWTDKLPHPANMNRYDELANDPETGIGIDLLAGMIAASFYTEMPEKDEKGAKIDPNHPNKTTIDNWAKGINAERKWLEIEHTKLAKGFCPVEKLGGGGLKCLPPEGFYIWRDKFGKTLKYTQEVAGSEVADWKGPEMNDIILYIHQEDTSHPYGQAITDRIAGLIDARKEINVDMPKIIHRYSAPKGVWATEGDVNDIYEAATSVGVDEDFFFGKVNKESFWFQFIEPTGQVRFLPYIEQIYFQIAESLHAPLILLLKNATEASAKTMLDSVDLFVGSEQRYDSKINEDRIYKPMVGIPTPLHKWGAPKEVFDNILLSDIGTLKGNGTITWAQAQDLIRQKGIPLIEDQQPLPPPIFGQPEQPGAAGAPKGKNGVPEPEPRLPLLDKPQMNALEMSLGVIRDSFDQHRISITEAIREGDRAINAYVDKAKHEAKRKLSETLGHSIDKMSPETERCFTLIHNELFDQFRESILPTKLRGVVHESTRSFTVTAMP